MRRIAIINPYYGRFPNYIDLWINSVEYNSTVDFYLITEKANILPAADNVFYMEMKLEELKERIRSALAAETGRMDICLDSPYKLCDFRPALGLVFEKELQAYDFWGFSDFDLIFGDIRKFVTEDLLSNYDKIYSHGHLTLFRNNSRINRMFLEKHNYYAYTWREAFSSRYSCHFDEWRGVSVIFREKGLKCYDKADFADIERRELQFRLAIGDTAKRPQIFEWKKGILSGYHCERGRVCQMEYLYIHLQKRNMELGQINRNHYYIVPNQFISARKPPDCELIRRLGKKSGWYPKKFQIYSDALKELLLRGEIRNRILLWKKGRKRK